MSQVELTFVIAGTDTGIEVTPYSKHVGYEPAVSDAAQEHSALRVACHKFYDAFCSDLKSMLSNLLSKYAIAFEGSMIFSCNSGELKLLETSCGNYQQVIPHLKDCCSMIFTAFTAFGEQFELSYLMERYILSSKVARSRHRLFLKRHCKDAYTSNEFAMYVDELPPIAEETCAAYVYYLFHSRFPEDILARLKRFAQELSLVKNLGFGDAFGLRFVEVPGDPERKSMVIYNRLLDD